MSPSPHMYSTAKNAASEGLRAAPIASGDNRWLKAFRTARREPGPERLAVEGLRLVVDALRSGLKVEAILSSDSGERYLPQLREFLEQSAPRPRLLRTSDRLFATVADTETPQGVAALVRPRAVSFDDLLRGEEPLVVALVGVQDPGNVGTIARAAEAFGSTGLIATRGTASPWSPKALRASAGSAFRLPILAGIAAPMALAQLRIAGLKIFAATASEAASPHPLRPDEADWRGPSVLLVGNEGAGLPPEIERSADTRICIPHAAAVDSLNAAVAASVLLYEAARQRGNLP